MIVLQYITLIINKYNKYNDRVYPFRGSKYYTIEDDIYAIDD